MMILFKHKLKLLLLFILAFSLGKNEAKAQDVSIVTTLQPPLPIGPQIAGASLTYKTVVSYSGPGINSVTVTLDFQGIELTGTVGTNPNPPGPITLIPIVGTTTKNVYVIDGLKNGYFVTFDYTCAITLTNSSAVNTTTIDPIGFVDTDLTNNISAVQTFIKPILTNPVNVTICSEKPVGETLSADNPFTSSYTWTATPSASTLSVRGPLGSNTIQDIITNTGNTNGTVVYAVTPRIEAPTISSTGTIGPVSTTTPGDPKTFTVTVRAPSQVLAVAVTGNGVIYSNESAVFTPNSSIPTATYTWYDSMNKTSVIGNGVLTKSNLSIGPHTFYVTATDPNFCEGPVFPATVNVLSLPVKARRDLTPNSDGIEDTWIITDIEQYPNCTIKIYDKWGNEVYSSTGYNTPWSGTFHNGLLPPASYYYIIDLNDGSRPLSGDVSIIK